MNAAFGVCVRCTAVCIQAAVCVQKASVSVSDEKRYAQTRICMSVVHGFNCHVGHLHHGDVVAMDELQHRRAPSWGSMNLSFTYRHQCP